MAAQIKFYMDLDFDLLPSNIKAQLMERSQTYHYAMETVSITLSNLQEQKLFEGRNQFSSVVSDISLLLTLFARGLLKWALY